jgi:hypothetical protein
MFCIESMIKELSNEKIFPTLYHRTGVNSVRVASCPPDGTYRNTSSHSHQHAYRHRPRNCHCDSNRYEQSMHRPRWADVSAYVTEFQFQTLNFINGVVVSEYLKTLRSIREKIANVVIDACTEHARELVLSSVDNRISAQEMMMTGKINDPNALTDAMMKEGPMIEAANAELARLGLKVVLSMPGSATLPSMPPNP